MAEGLPTAQLTCLEFKPQDHAVAQALARRLGYTQFAYTSTSALWGLFCLPENPASYRGAALATAGVQRRQFPPFVAGCVIKTPELGFMFVQDLEDLRAKDLE